MSKRLVWLLLLPLISCARDRYLVEMIPTESGFTRRLAVGRGSADISHMLPEHGAPANITQGALNSAKLDTEDVLHLLPLYGESTETTLSISQLGLTGDFEVSTPDDIGGAGLLARLDSPLGSSWTYLERLRGDDDLIAQRARRSLAIDVLSSHWLRYLDSELASESGWPRVRDLLAGPVLADLRNLIETAGVELGVLIGEEDLDDDDGKRALMRILIYLHERDYLDAETVAWLSTVGSFSASESHWRRLRSGRLRPLVDFIESPESERARALLEEKNGVEQSYELFLARSVESTRLQVWYAMDRSPEEALELPTEEIIERLLFVALGVRYFQHFDEVNLSLVSGREPLATNGEWEAESGKIHWFVGLDTGRVRPTSYPKILFAVWLKPAEQEQRALLGDLQLDGQELADYVAWWAGLTGSQREHFERVVGPGLIAKDSLRELMDDDFLVWNTGATILIKLGCQ